MKKVMLPFLMACFVAPVFASPPAARSLGEGGRVDAPRAAVPQRTEATETPRTETARTATVAARAAATPNVSARSAIPQNVSARAAVQQRPTAQNISARSATPNQPAARAAAPANAARSATAARSAVAPEDTRTGAAYEQCRNVFFACMDQFCAMKDRNFLRCSCSNRIFDIISAQSVMQDAATQLTQFNENLDTVGMTANQAAAMREATEGELALTDDGSEARKLLNAIMNAIRGEDATVGGRNQQLNSINLAMSFDTGVGAMDGQALAAHNGDNLYTAIYGRCREVVRPYCNDRSLQRAVLAYRMAIEQDCNNLQTRIDEVQRTLSTRVRESGAMLGLARVEDRQRRNQSDRTTCLREVEEAILSPQVCGPGYRRCLDNGVFIDPDTGRPREDVVEFYRLASMLTFSENLSLADQRLARVPGNREFVSNFERRVRQFAEPALGRCVEIRDEVWLDFLDKALLEIYYAQNAKVQEIKQGCMDFVSMCFMGGERALTQAMSALVDDRTTNQPNFIVTADALCTRQIAACDNMFAGNIIAEYIATRTTTDVTTACRAIVQNCFDRFGGQNYVNFWSGHSGLFQSGRALDWFSFETLQQTTVSECARELLDVAACNPPDNPNFARNIFGGFTKLGEGKYGSREEASEDFPNKIAYTGVATEVYYRIIDILRTNCENRHGVFSERRFDSFRLECNATSMCPWHVTREVETASWGVCISCPGEEMGVCQGLAEPRLECITHRCGCPVGQIWNSATSSCAAHGISCPSNSSFNSYCIGSTRGERDTMDCVAKGCACNGCFSVEVVNGITTCVRDPHCPEIWLDCSSGVCIITPWDPGQITTY
jgi:hypothetical protein